MSAYYNEIDPKAAAWLRELIRRGLIADGDVDERSIEDVRPVELLGYTQCHFFAGIGVWSYALRQAGWPDDRPVWTASCPCQPFSAAGKGGGFADERHLWPAAEWLIRHAKPSGVPVFGEQVASKDGLAWLDVVQADLEGQGYAVGAVDSCAAGFGAPHIRQRLYWVALPLHSQRGSLDVDRQDGRDGTNSGRAEAHGEPRARSEVCRVADAERAGLEGLAGDVDYPRGRSFPLGSVAASGAVGGWWRDAHVVYCRDKKLRPVEPGTFPLAHGAPARVGRLRGYGNAIVAAQATEFVIAAQQLIDFEEYSHFCAEEMGL